MNKTPITIANSTVKKYNTRDPFQIAKEKNVILVYAHLIDIRGFYQYFQRQHIICIDQDLSDQEKKFVCAHELGHMMMHKNSNAIYMDTQTFFNTNKLENEANTFAVNLLIPDESIVEVIDNQNCTLEYMSRMLGYNQKLIELRLRTFDFDMK